MYKYLISNQRPVQTQHMYFSSTTLLLQLRREVSHPHVARSAGGCALLRAGSMPFYPALHGAWQTSAPCDRSHWYRPKISAACRPLSPPPPRLPLLRGGSARAAAEGLPLAPAGTAPRGVRGPVGRQAAARPPPQSRPGAGAQAGWRGRAGCHRGATPLPTQPDTRGPGTGEQSWRFGSGYAPPT